MILKKSFYNVVKDNLKRFWSLGLLFIMWMVLTEILPISSDINVLTSRWSRLDDILKNIHYGIQVYVVLAPIITVMILFRYLNSTKGSVLMHSLPLRKKEMYLGTLVSGWILIMLPLIFRYVIIMLFKKPVVTSMLNVDIYTTTRVNTMFLLSIGMTNLGYAISVLATMLTGSTMSQGIFAGGLYALVPTLRVVLVEYFNIYLFGYRNLYFGGIQLQNFTPLAHIFNENNLTNEVLFTQFIVLIVTLLILIVSYVLYAFRPIEKTGDTIIFGKSKLIFKLILSFIGMTVLGFIFENLKFDFNIKIIGYILGGVIALILSEMIIQQTFYLKIKVKSAGIIIFILSIISAFIFTDISGYESAVPEISEIESIYVGDGTNYMMQMTSMSHIAENINNEYNYTENKFFRKKEELEVIIGLHQEIVNNKKEIEQQRARGVAAISLTIIYHLKNGEIMNREYVVKDEIMYRLENYKKMMENDKYQLIKANLFEIDYESIQSILVSEFKKESVSYLIVEDEAKMEFLNVLSKDVMNETVYDMVSHYQSEVYYAEFIKYKNETKDEGEDKSGVSGIRGKPYDVLITRDFDNTIKWLEENYNEVYKKID